MTFDELSAAVYEDLNGHVVTVSSDGVSYRVLFECNDWCGSDRQRRFELVFDDVPESTVAPSACGWIRIFDEHPLLWQHNDQGVSMYFSSALSEPLALLGRLYEAHTALFGGWRELSDYWKASSNLLQTGYGRLAAGPSRAIDEYARVIGDTLRYTIIHGYNPRGGYRVVLLDEGYIVCRSVSVIEHELNV